jgi:type IV pilus assembly protein PilX
MNPAHKQNGVVLFIALIVLVAMSLAGVALWRSIGTGVLIAGNIAIQRGAVTSSDRGIEAARTWLMNQTPTVLNSDQTRAYVSSWDNRFDATTFNWDALGSAVTAADTDGAGFTTQYVVHRLCSLPNAGHNAPNQQCLTLSVAGGSSGRGGGSYGVLPLSGTTYIYYRITSRAVGPRNTVSYTQSIMY